MNEESLRDLVRESVARHLARVNPPAPLPAERSAVHASHGLYMHLVNATEACLIEPAVRCNRCGYCKTHGH